MAPDDSDADSARDEQNSVSGKESPAAGTDTARRAEQSLPEQLSQTAPIRRAYGMERVNGQGGGVGLLTSRERRYLHHVQRLDPPDRNAVEDVLSDRVAEFVESEWPLISEEYPDIAAALQEELCRDGSS